RLARRNTAKQAQSQKRRAAIAAARLFSGPDGAPRIVAVVPLAPDVPARGVVCALASALGEPEEEVAGRGVWRVRAERFKTSLQFVNVPYGNFYAALDACRAADYVVLALSTTIEVDTWGDTLLRTLQAQGLPQVVAVASPSTPTDAHAPTDAATLKSLLSFTRYFVPTLARVFDLGAGADRLGAVRALAEGRPGEVRWRAGRAWVLGERVEWADGGDGEGGAGGVLRVTGVVRGAALSPDRLVHVPGVGDFQVEKIVSAPLPRRSKSGQAMDVEPALLAEADPAEADSLVSSNDPDDMANEQTWPTEEEMHGPRGDADADGQGDADGERLPPARKGTTPRTIRRIPKGMSEYQAAWILDESEDEDEEGGEGGGEGGDGGGGGEGGSGEGVEMDEEMVDMPVRMDDDEMESEARKSVVAFQDLDVDEEAQ
ncbi:AARP2CN-domain-containing protein, partial [Leucogyrophana mollusca]